MNARKFSCWMAMAALVFTFCFSAHADDAAKKYADLASKPLADTKPGDPKAGRKAFFHRKKGNCLACHVVKDLEHILFHGEVGPPLNDVGNNYSESELRLQVINPKINNEDSIMPAYFRVDGLKRVLLKFKDKSILTAQEVEDIVAYMMTLKEE